MKKLAGYFLAGLLGAALGSALPALHAQGGGLIPELREIHVNGQKVTPKEGVINLQFTAPVSVSDNSGDAMIFIPPAPSVETKN